MKMVLGAMIESIFVVMGEPEEDFANALWQWTNGED
jgi:hypothetical protein